MDLDDDIVRLEVSESESDSDSGSESGSDECEEMSTEVEGGESHLVKTIRQRDTFNTSSQDIYTKRYPVGLPSTTSDPSTASTSTSGPPDTGDAVGAGQKWGEGVGGGRMIREYDVVDVGRGNVGGSGLNIGGRDGTRDGGEGGERAEVKPGYHPLDCNARHQLAVARIKIGDEEQRKYHASIILSSDLVLFREIADAYFDREMYEDVKVIYELSGVDLATSSVYAFLQTPPCIKNIGESRDTANVMSMMDGFWQHFKPRLCLADSTNNHAKMKLAEIHEIFGETRMALSHRFPKKRKISPTSPSGTPAPCITEDPTTTSLLAEDKFLNASKTKWGEAVDVVGGGVGAGGSQGLEEVLVAESAFDESACSPETEPDGNRMADRLQFHVDTLAQRNTKSAGIEAVMQYCFILTKRGQDDVAEEILQLVTVSNAYQPQHRQISICIALITCSILAERSDVVVEQAHKLIMTHQFNNEPLRILLDSLPSGLKLTDSFFTSMLRKYLFREMKLSDMAVKNPWILRWDGLNRRYAAAATTSDPAWKNKAEDVDKEKANDETPAPTTGGGGATATANVERAPRIPTKKNPVIVAIHGQIYVAAKSYQGAISMAFLTKYRKLRGTTTAGVREVERNFATTFHQLGFYSHAVKLYVLALAEQAGSTRIG
ncbi:hypothetical protein BJ165DRAFT_1409809 [Panaeolus papilionaceus]|nr:hypothetical protein BJ165DRAFT_1409809 [Panaeolus papilionaceus]